MLSVDSTLLETAFTVLNRIYFDGSLPKVVITIQSSPKCFGYITVHQVWQDSEASYHEINIAAEYLTRPIENVLATLMHEMIHLYCMVNGIQDTSNGGRYHNKRFKAEAEQRDLQIRYTKYAGHSATSPTEQFIGVIQAHGLYAQIGHCRIFPPPPSPTSGNDLGTAGGDTEKKKTSTRKYLCNGCGISIRATKDVNLICGDCMDTMVKVD